MAWQKDVLATRLEGLRRSLQLTDRVLSGDSRVTLRFDSKMGQHPALSRGPAITVFTSFIPDLESNSGLVHLLGLNYHEVAHVRYSVNPSELSRKIGSLPHPRFTEAYQVLEEARVETLLVARYKRLAKYFTYPVIRHFVQDESTWPTAFLFTHGRRYLPRRIRDTFRDEFLKQHTPQEADAFARLIDQYRLLPLTMDSYRRQAARIIEDFAKLMGSAGLPNQGSHPLNEGGQTEEGYNKSAEVSLKPSKESGDDAKKAVQEAQEQDEKEQQGEDGSGFDEEEEENGENSGEASSGDGDEIPDDDIPDGGAGVLAGDSEPEDQGSDKSGEEEPEDEPGEEGEPDGSGDGEDPEEEDDEPGDGDDSGNSSDNDGSGLGDSGGEGESQEGGNSNPPADGSGVGKGKGKRGKNPNPFVAEDADELADTLQEVVRAVLSDDDVQQELSGLRDAMEDAGALGSSLQPHFVRSRKLVPVTPEMFREADRVKDVLRQLWAQMEPGWQYGLSEGARIDMNRAALAKGAEDYDSIYADWEPGQQDNSGLCVVVLADESGSMMHRSKNGSFFSSRRIDLVSQHVWELMYVLNEIEAEATFITYDTNARTLYERGETVTSSGYIQLEPLGGTYPVPAVEEARRILTLTEMRHRLFVVVSDGDWTSSMSGQNGDLVTRSLEALGPDCTKVAILVGDDNFVWANKFDVVGRTDGPIFEIMARAVVNLIERSVHQ
jgi:hypothetical protein